MGSQEEKQQWSPDEHHTFGVLSGAAGSSSPAVLSFPRVMTLFSLDPAQTPY